MEKSASEFTLDAGDTLIDETDEARIDQVYKFDDFAPFINLDCIGCDETEEVSTKTPFEKIKQKMMKVTEDGKISKLVRCMFIELLCLKREWSIYVFFLLVYYSVCIKKHLWINQSFL